METASEYLESALQVGMKELAALRGGDVDAACQLAAQREELTSLAWDARRDVPGSVLREGVLRLHSLQETLMREARLQQERLRRSLNETHRQQRGMRAYGCVVGHALRNASGQAPARMVHTT